MTLYVPKEAIKKRDSILIVDDMIKTGETQAAMVNLVKRAKADIAGVYSIIAVGEEWQKKINLPKELVEVVTRISAAQQA
jgi:adenine phosphoribosyltransferase